MTDNPPPPAGGPMMHAGNTAAAGIPYYEKQRQHLKEMINRKRALEKRLVSPLPFQSAATGPPLCMSY